MNDLFNRLVEKFTEGHTVQIGKTTWKAILQCADKYSSHAFLARVRLSTDLSIEQPDIVKSGMAHTESVTWKPGPQTRHRGMSIFFHFIDDISLEQNLKEFDKFAILMHDNFFNIPAPGSSSFPDNLQAPS